MTLIGSGINILSLIIVASYPLFYSPKWSTSCIFSLMRCSAFAFNTWDILGTFCYYAIKSSDG